MALRNKETGETYCNGIPPKPFCVVIGNGMECYSSLAEVNEKWEDCEEPKGYWYYDTTSAQVDKLNHNEDKEIDSSIGNCFETKEEAEKAVEKLKAWKRLKDKGFRFTHWECTGSISFTFDNYCGDGQPMSASDDLDLLFGGEE